MHLHLRVLVTLINEQPGLPRQLVANGEGAHATKLLILCSNATHVRTTAIVTEHLHLKTQSLEGQRRLFMIPATEWLVIIKKSKSSSGMTHAWVMLPDDLSEPQRLEY